MSDWRNKKYILVININILLICLDSKDKCLFVDQVAVKGDALRSYFSLSYDNDNVLDQNSLMMIMYSFRQYCFLSVADMNMIAQVIELNLLTNHASY